MMMAAGATLPRGALIAIQTEFAYTAVKATRILIAVPVAVAAVAPARTKAPEAAAAKAPAAVQAVAPARVTVMLLRTERTVLRRPL